MKPTLTKRDFETIATALSGLIGVTLAETPEGPKGDALRVRLRRYHADAVRDVATVLARANGRFDASRFQSLACDGKPDSQG